MHSRGAGGVDCIFVCMAPRQIHIGHAKNRDEKRKLNCEQKRGIALGQNGYKYFTYSYILRDVGMRDVNISPGMRDDNSSPYICEIIYICEMGKRDDDIHMRRYCNVYVYVYVYLCTSVYI